MKILDIEQGSQEWLDLRKTKVTATDIAKIIGISPWGNIRTLYMQKKGFIDEAVETDAMRRGKELEPLIRERSEIYLLQSFKPIVGIHEEFDFAMASFDGINEKNKTLLEIKTASKVDHKEASNNRIPEKYYPQIQWQLFVSGYKLAYYASYHIATDDLVVISVERDDVKILEYYEQAKKFMQLEEIPDFLENDEIYHTDLSWGLLCNELKELNESLKKLEASIEESKNKMLEFLKKNDVLHVKSHKGGVVEVCNVSRKGAIKFENIPGVREILEKIDCDLYRAKDTNYWKFSIKES